MKQLGTILSDLRSSSRRFVRGLVKKPLSLTITLVALGLLSLTLIELGRGSLYVARLNYVDVTTLAMVALLLLRAVTRLPSKSDLETVSIALVSSLSFVFGYEAIYKWSFYFLPWRMSASELREFVLQIAIASVVLTGFAQKVFKLGRCSLVLLGLFATSWFFWLAIGFPQLWDGLNFYDAVLELPMTWGMIYALNRFTKLLWFMFHFCLYAGKWSKPAA
jgi:hypothetical protein